MDRFLTKLDEMDPEERSKIFKILKDEKEGGEKMDWMYKADKPDTEEYLLGRRIDKHIEEQDKPEENKDAPGALFQEVLVRRAELDMQAKMREDPLYAIKQKEEEARKRLLQNPIKLKQLQKLMKECEKKKKKKEKKKKKKSKKKHKKSSDSDDSDDEILNQYLALLKQNKPTETHRNERQHRHDSDERTERRRVSEERRHHDEGNSDRKRDETRKYEYYKSHKQYREVEEHKPRSDRYNSDDSNDGEEEEEDVRKKSRHKSYGLLVRGEKNIKMEQSGSQERRRERSDSQSRSQLSEKRIKTGKTNKHDRSRSRSPQRSKSPSRPRSKRYEGKAEAKRKHSSSPSRRESRKKLTAEEMERRRVEMMENARWRDEQRERNVRRYREEEAKEKEALEKHGASSDFLNPMLMKHASNTSVEDRIKRNIYNIQRTKVDLEKNFAKR